MEENNQVDRWYYYLHTNGDLIGKNPEVVECDSLYFESDFVKKYWLIECRKDLVGMLLEAKKLGARDDRVKEIEVKNTITKDDYTRWYVEEGMAFKCPVCKMVSYNPNDIKNSYCGNCHKFY